jgi:hypothetical protein
MKLRLGPVPDNSVTKMSVSIPASLKAQLDKYAEIHSASFGAPVDAQTLIPMMLAGFLAKDRAFQRAIRRKSDSSGVSG